VIIHVLPSGLAAADGDTAKPGTDAFVANPTSKANGLTLAVRAIAIVLSTA
tara:strand:+ start:45641 stop:45793 length:153 start_codon:yes stop_codon:yes gene_type:complete